MLMPCLYSFKNYMIQQHFFSTVQQKWMRAIFFADQKIAYATFHFMLNLIFANWLKIKILMVCWILSCLFKRFISKICQTYKNCNCVLMISNKTKNWSIHWHRVSTLKMPTIILIISTQCCQLQVQHFCKCFLLMSFVRMTSFQNILQKSPTSAKVQLCALLMPLLPL